jgi:integrase
MASDIDSKAKRDKLAARREPYWEKLEAGEFLGYRRTKTGGTWIARYRDDEGKQHYKSLSLPPHAPVDVHKIAAKEARKWFATLDQGANFRSGTVAEAADAYVEYLRVKNGDDAAADAKGRINRLIRVQLGKRRVDKLRQRDIEEWFFEMVPAEGKPEALRKAKASANRNFNCLKAILNRAYATGEVTTDAAWRHVERFEGVDGARKVFLTKPHVAALLKVTTGGFHELCFSAVRSGARYGELRANRVKDFDREAGVLHVREGKTGQRIVPLTDELFAHFSKLAKDKLPDAYLHTRDDGEPWGHSDQDGLMRAAAKAAKLPAGTVFYTLRHTWIAQSIVAGMDIFSVAKVAGTSVEMIMKHYGKLLQDRVKEAMTKAAAAA